MTKTQKILLTLSLVIFLMPEVLWATLSNVVYEFMQNGGNVLPYRNSFLMSYKFEALYKAIIILQFVSIIIFFSLWIMIKTNVKSNAVFWFISILSGLALLVTLGIFYLIVIFNPNSL